MAPPRARGGSRSTSILALLTLAIALLASHASAAVLGVDVGTQFFKAVLVKPGNPFDIVLTKDTRRKEAATVAFKPSTSGPQSTHPFPERLFGADAFALAPRFPSDVYPNLKPLLGNTSDITASIEAYQRRFPAIDLVQDASDHSIAIKSSIVEGPAFSIEEMIAMQLKNVKANAQNMAGKGHLTEDVAITVPAYYTAEERLAIQTAADLAGLNVLALISDGLSVGLDYAMSRTFPNVDKGEKPEYHMVFDMGTGSTTATILRFQARTVKDIGKLNKTISEVTVLGTDWDRTLGGDALNEIILDDMVSKFVDSSAAKSAGVEETAVRKHGRAMAKLWKESERLRMVLSANQQTQASFEGLFEDIDFKYKISRKDFEELASGYASRISAPIDGALSAAKLGWADLNSVVLHGGVTRTPFVQKSLESLADDATKLRGNVNADESAVMGAAYKAAGFSPSFRVKKEIKSFDSANYGASLVWTSGGKERKQGIFVPTSTVGTVKQIPLSKLEDFELTIVQTIPQGQEKVDRPIYQIAATNVTASVNELVKSYACDKDGIKTQVSARLNPLTSLPEIVSGSVSCESEVQEKKNMVDGVKNLFGFGGKKDQKPLGESDKASGEDEAAPSSEEAATSTASSSAPASASASAASDKKDEAPKKKTHTIPLALTITRLGTSKTSTNDLVSTKQRLTQFDASDAGRRMREDYYNRLEAYTYRARDLLTDASFIGASSKSQRDAIEQSLSVTSEWLYSDGATAALDAVKEKLQSLEALVNPIKTRGEEAAKRPAAVKALNAALNSSESVIRVIKGSLERAAQAASSAAEAASSAAAEAATASPSADEDNLEEPEATTTPKPTPSAEPSRYTEQDLEDATSLYDAVKAWLAEQLEAQQGLATSEDPVLTLADLERRTEQLQDLATRLLSKTPPRSSSSKTKSSTRTKKSKKSKSTTATSNSPSVAAEEATPVATPAGEDKIRDEL